MKKIITALLVLLTTCVFAQKLDKYKITENWYELKKDRKQETKTDQIKQLIKDEFKLRTGEDFIKVSEEIDKSGNTHSRYKHFIDGIPVYGSEYFIHKKTNSEYVDVLYTKIFKDIKIKKQQLSENSALKIALEKLPANLYCWQDKYYEDEIKEDTKDPKSTHFPKGKLLYYPKELSNSSAADFELCFSFIINASKPNFSKEIFINAVTGGVVRIKDLNITCSSAATATTLYHGNRNIITDWIGWPTNRYRLQECNRNIHTKYGSGLNPEAKNSTTTWGTNDQLATSAHWAAEMTWDLYWNVYGRRGTNNQGRQIKVHADDPSATARGGAYYNFSSGNNDKIHIGNSPQGLNCASLDVVGHEITHGLVNATADLENQNESGALNESFADIFGLMTERRALNGVFNWRMGEAAWPNTNGIRSFDNPNIFLHPSIFGGINWINTNGCAPTNENDQCGVHFNSGVQNHWFFLLSNGGFQNGVAVNGIGLDNAARIAWNNLTLYLGKWSNYNDARNGSINAALDLFGECSNEVQQVRNAWAAVGVGPVANPNCITISPSSWITICYDEPWNTGVFPITLTANFTPANGIVTWDVPAGFNFTATGNVLTITDGPVTPYIMVPITATATSNLGGTAAAQILYMTDQCHPEFSKSGKSSIVTTEMSDLKALNIYPNPVNNLLTVDLQEPSTVIIAELNGKVLQTKNLSNGNNKLSTQLLPNGTYIMTVKSKTKSKAYKILVMH